MTRFGRRISSLAAASLLFANVACTCAVAGTHAGHEADSAHATHHAHHDGAHAEHQHAAPAQAREPQHEDDLSDRSCHQVLADCADCGPGATPTIKQDRDLRLPWMQWDQGEKADHLFASAAPIANPKFSPGLSPVNRRPSLPALGSPITRKDQLTE